MEKLKPCPFCGGEPELEDWTHVYESGTTIRCKDCDAHIVEGVDDGNGWHDRAVRKWNRRTVEIIKTSEYINGSKRIERS